MSCCNTCNFFVNATFIEYIWHWDICNGWNEPASNQGTTIIRYFTFKKSNSNFKGLNFLDLAVAKSLQSIRMVTDDDDDDDADADVLTTTGYTCWLLVEPLVELLVELLV